MVLLEVQKTFAACRTFAKLPLGTCAPDPVSESTGQHIVITELKLTIKILKS